MVSTTLPRQRPSVSREFQIKIRAIWRFLLRQPPSFWLVNFYLFLEYVRPQSIYPVLAFMPWAQTTLIAATLAVFLEGRIPQMRTAISGLVLAFTAVVVLSSLFAWSPAASFAKWELFFSWILIYILIINTVTTEKRFFIFVLAFLLYSFKMSQHGFRSWLLGGFGFSSWGVTGAPGWFHNSGEVGIQMCIFVPMSVEFILALRRNWGKPTRIFFYLMPLTAIATIVASSSRGALVGAACVALWYILRSKQRVRTLLAVIVVGSLTWAVVPPEQKARFETAGEDETSTKRTDRWGWGLQVAAERPVFGLGYENWHPYFGGRLSHNVFIQAVSELGYTGLGVFVALIVASFVVNFRTRRLLRGVPTETPLLTHMAYGLDGALIGFMGSAFFVTVLYYPFFWIHLSMVVALHTAARRERRRWVLQSRRAAGIARVPGGPAAPPIGPPDRFATG